MIVNKLNDGSIWIDYEICKSPGDGHCFIYSVLSSLNSRADPGNITQYESLINALRNEVINNLRFYVPFTKGSSVDRLLVGLNAYSYHMIYDTFFGDIVTHGMANVLQIPIVIIHQFGVSVICLYARRANTSMAWPMSVPIATQQC